MGEGIGAGACVVAVSVTPFDVGPGRGRGLSFTLSAPHILRSVACVDVSSKFLHAILVPRSIVYTHFSCLNEVMRKVRIIMLEALPRTTLAVAPDSDWGKGLRFALSPPRTPRQVVRVPFVGSKVPHIGQITIYTAWIQIMILIF